MDKKLLFLVIVVLVILYIFLINEISYFSVLSINENQSILESQSDGVQIGVNEEVNIFVVRHRFYGRIEETNSDSKLYLFEQIPLPLKNNNFNFIYIHILFLIFIVFLIIKFFRRDMKGGIEIIEEWEPNGGNSY